uniref:uncharacterized protein LOC122778476 isoform X1 n=1 Tax=Solea senegalensis TaxID=28829 RepID=UPI001CD85901|nr:uncharacterized protein LOC122778476 isoform X1 [Solea senegalensis]
MMSTVGDPPQLSFWILPFNSMIIKITKSTQRNTGVTLPTVKMKIMNSTLRTLPQANWMWKFQRMRKPCHILKRTDSASNEGENHVDDEDVMEGNSTRETTTEFSVGSEDQADGDKPLYPGAPVSKGESLLMLMSYVLWNNLTGKALTHLLELFNLMFPGLVPPSHYLFHKECGSSSQSKVHFYCEKCLAYLGISADCPSHCTLCNTVFDANTSLKKGFYFIVIPLHAQIKQLLQEHDVSLTEKSRSFGVLTDIQSGGEYQKMCDSGILGKDDMTLIWNCDGAPVFKSSKCSIWPIQCQIIELEPEMRKRHILTK